MFLAHAIAAMGTHLREICITGNPLERRVSFILRLKNSYSINKLCWTRHTGLVVGWWNEKQEVAFEGE